MVKIGQNRSKLVKLVKLGQNRSKLVKIGQISQIRSKLVKMDQNWSKWVKSSQNRKLLKKKFFAQRPGNGR